MTRPNINSDNVFGHMIVPFGIPSASFSLHSAEIDDHAQMTRISAALGCGALVTLGALSAAYGGIVDTHPGRRIEAGSGSAPTNTTYQQPVVGGMNLGATATWSAPASAPETAKAVPAKRGS